MHSTIKFKDLIKVLEEDYDNDPTIPDVVRDQTGIANEYSPEKSSVSDIMARNNRSDVAPENIPYPLNEFDDVATNAYTSIQNLEELLKIAKTNAVIKNKKPLDPICKELIRLKKDIVDISKKVSKIK
jgi:hypothetical protein